MALKSQSSSSEHPRGGQRGPPLKHDQTPFQPLGPLKKSLLVPFFLRGALFCDSKPHIDIPYCCFPVFLDALLLSSQGTAAQHLRWSKPSGGRSSALVSGTSPRVRLRWGVCVQLMTKRPSRRLCISMAQIEICACHAFCVRDVLFFPSPTVNSFACKSRVPPHTSLLSSMHP